MSMQLVFSQILIILIYVAVGFGAGKLHLIDANQRKFLSKLCSDLFLPFMILAATSRDLSAKDVSNMAVAATVGFFVMLSTTGLSLLYHKITKAGRERRAVVTALVTYPNSGFLGIPLCMALFGEIAVLYGALMIVIFNALFFTLQYILFLPEKPNLKNLCTPATFSTILMLIMLSFGLHFPDPVQTGISGIGSILSPLSLIVIGVMLSENKLSRIFTEKTSYIVVLIRNLLIPVAVILLFKLLPLDDTSSLCMMVYLGCPCATLTTIYAMQLDLEPTLCVNSVLLSTLCFSFTLPLIILIGQAVF